MRYYDMYGIARKVWENSKEKKKWNSEPYVSYLGAKGKTETWKNYRVNVGKF